MTLIEYNTEYIIKIVIVLTIAIACILAYNYYTTGKFFFIPEGSVAEQKTPAQPVNNDQGRSEADQKKHPPTKKEEPAPAQNDQFFKNIDEQTPREEDEMPPLEEQIDL